MTEQITDIQQIKRYNQGFGVFGPLELANDGKLVKYDDVADLYANHLHKESMKALEIYQNNQKHRKELDSLNTRLELSIRQSDSYQSIAADTFKEAKRYARQAHIWFFIAIIEAIVNFSQHIVAVAK